MEPRKAPAERAMSTALSTAVGDVSLALAARRDALSDGNEGGFSRTVGELAGFGRGELGELSSNEDAALEGYSTGGSDAVEDPESGERE